MGKKVALPIFVLFLSILSIYAQSSYERGERLYLEGNYPLALDAFDDFLRSNPDSPLVADAQFRRAQILFHLKRFREADELFQRIEVRYSSTQFYPSLPFWSGITAYGLKDYGRADLLLSKYLQESPPPSFFGRLPL
jgi:tetratricopeptide (TPR) repeat protein